MIAWKTLSETVAFRFGIVGLVMAVTAGVGIPAHSQQPTGLPRIGILGASSANLEVFRTALGERGFVEGRGVVIDPRSPDGGRLDLLPETAAALAKSKPDVIVAVGATVARAVIGATKDIPVVFVIVVDPVADGLVPNLERPDGNVTGVTSFDPHQTRRQLEFLRRALPGLSRVALLTDAGAVSDLVQSNEEAARALGLAVQVLTVERSANPDFAGALEAVRKTHAGAVVVISTPVTAAHRKTIVELATKSQLPTLSPSHHEDAAPFIAYGTTFAELTRRSAGYVASILKGRKPGDLPIETVSQPEIILNTTTARKLGIAFSREMLDTATRVKE